MRERRWRRRGCGGGGDGRPTAAASARRASGAGLNEWPRQTWLDAEPEYVRREHEEMASVAPEMVWVDESAGGWEGLAPEWPFERPRPDGLDRLLGGRRLRL